MNVYLKILKKKFILICIFVFICIFNQNAFSDNREKIVLNLLNEAVKYIETNGIEKAFWEFTFGKKFKIPEEDIYIFVLDSNCTIVAHGGNATNMIGRNLSEVKDTNGVKYMKKFVEDVLRNGNSKISYHCPIYATRGVYTNINAVDLKYVYGIRYKNYVIGSGYYKDKIFVPAPHIVTPYSQKN